MSGKRHFYECGVASAANRGLLRVSRGHVQVVQPYQPQVERRSDCIRSASSRARRLQLAGSAA
jgi:hypothetical protein